MSERPDRDDRVRRAAEARGQPLGDCVEPPGIDPTLWASLRSLPESEPERAAAEAHLEACAHCRTLALAPPVSPALEARLLGALEAGRAPHAHPLRRWAWAGAAVALAAGLLAAVALRDRAGRDVANGNAATLEVAFEALAIEGGIAPTRGEVVDRPVFGPRSQLRWVVRPRTEPPVPVSARAFVRRPGTADFAVLPEESLTRTEGGAMVLEGQGAAILGPSPGTAELVIVAWRPDGRPAPAVVPTDAGAANGRVFAIYRMQVVLASP